MSLDTVLEKAKVYDFPEDKAISQESGRLEFISKFPMERIGSLTIDEYVAGTDKNSFSYWLEFKKILFGIGGGNASKFGIYKGSDGNYYGGTGQNKILLQGQELENQFQKIKTAIVTALDYVKLDKISEIKNLDMPIWNMVLQKILTIYYPDKFFSIGASDALIALANDIKLKNVDISPKNLIEINYECRKFISAIPEFKDWHYEKLSTIVWANYRKDKNDDSSNSDFLKEILSKNKAMVKQNSSPTLNSILFGPPGTGKTYNSIDKAVEIATGKSVLNHTENKKQFDELRKQGQIEFVTFHQNYSYEDFMVGIRPNINEGSEFLSFKSHTGIFYEIAKRARENYFNSLKDAETLTYESWVKDMFDEFQEFVEDVIEKDGKFIIKNAVSIFSVEEDAFIYTGEKSGGEKWKNERLGMHYEPLILMFLANVQGRKDIKALDNIPSLEKQHSTYCFEVIQKFREYLKQNKKVFAKVESKIEELRKYVLVIDEINRANISKVFGELITLLEDDKRLGGENEIRITLTNGEREFGVPPNLYIIGTMNTADKSIALIDIALRRRFEFIGYYPKYENINEDEATLLNKINEAIFKEKKSADYLIGHAYFMKGQTIKTVLENKVVPLLMEYFSGKTDIVSKIFADTSWSVIYNTTNYIWDITPR